VSYHHTGAARHDAIKRILQQQQRQQQQPQHLQTDSRT
jgi:hypothetical protein